MGKTVLKQHEMSVWSKIAKGHTDTELVIFCNMSYVVSVGALTVFFRTGRTGQASEASAHHPARVHAHGPGT